MITKTEMGRRAPLRALAAGTCSALMCFSSAAFAQYVDDRSSAESVVLSYYNAISSQQYARAWSYWGEDGHPDQTYDQFYEGFENTAHVDVVVGTDFVEGAAGSIFHAIPVAIAVWDEDQTGPHYFTGCFFLRMAQPTIQEPLFEGLHIYAASLEASEVPHFDALVDSCAP